jgi:hypothetical protein
MVVGQPVGGSRLNLSITVVLRTVETEHGQDRNCGARGSLSHRWIVLLAL